MHYRFEMREHGSGISRTLVVPAFITFADLEKAVDIAMGWGSPGEHSYVCEEMGLTVGGDGEREQDVLIDAVLPEGISRIAGASRIDILRAETLRFSSAASPVLEKSRRRNRPQDMDPEEFGALCDAAESSSHPGHADAKKFIDSIPRIENNAVNAVFEEEWVSPPMPPCLGPVDISAVQDALSYPVDEDVLYDRIAKLPLPRSRCDGPGTGRYVLLRRAGDDSYQDSRVEAFIDSLSELNEDGEEECIIDADAMVKAHSEGRGAFLEFIGDECVEDEWEESLGDGPDIALRRWSAVAGVFLDPEGEVEKCGASFSRSVIARKRGPLEPPDLTLVGRAMASPEGGEWYFDFETRKAVRIDGPDDADAIRADVNRYRCIRLPRDPVPSDAMGAAREWALSLGIPLK